MEWKVCVSCPMSSPVPGKDGASRALKGRVNRRSIAPYFWPGCGNGEAISTLLGSFHGHVFPRSHCSISEALGVLSCRARTASGRRGSSSLCL